MRQSSASQLPRHTALLSPVAASLALAMSLAGCRHAAPEAARPNARPPHGGEPTTLSACVENAPPPPVLTKAAPPAFPVSRVSLKLVVPQEDLLKRLGREVPEVLAQEKDRPVGAPGRATYTVKRGAFHLGIDGDRVGLSVPISADISVCKPFGSACLRYGTCQPRFDVHFGLNVELPKDYYVEPPRGSLVASRKCVIGLDVTDQLESVAKKELAKVQAQIAARWPDTRTEVAQAWGALNAPLRVTPMDCVLFDGKSVSYQAPHFSKDGDKLVWAMGVEGSLRPANSCTQDHHAGPLPAPEKQPDIPSKSELWIPEFVEVAKVEKAMEEKLGGSFGSDPKDRVSVGEVRVEGAEVAAMLVLEGPACEAMWLTAELAHESGKGIVLASPELRLLESTKISLPRQQQLLQYLTQISLVKTHGDAWTATPRVKALLDQVRAELPKHIHLDVSLNKPRKSRVQLTTEGVLVLHSIRARLKVDEI